MIHRIKGELEIDHDRGVIYFHAEEEDWINEYNTVTILRIGKLGPIFKNKPIDIVLQRGEQYEVRELAKE